MTLLQGMGQLYAEIYTGEPKKLGMSLLRAFKILKHC